MNYIKFLFYCLILSWGYHTNCNFCLAKVDVDLDSEFLDTQATQTTLQELESRLHLSPRSVGGGSMSVVRLFHVTVETYQILTMEEARRIALDATDIYLKNVNGMRELRPFLAEYPFPPKRIILSFFLTDPETRNFRKVNGFSLFRMNQGKIQFLLDDAKSHQLKIVREESFQEAREIVANEKLGQQTQQASPKSNCSLLPDSSKTCNDSIVKTFFTKLTSLRGFPKDRHFQGNKYAGTHFSHDLFRYLDYKCKKFREKYDLDLIRIGDFTDSSPYKYYSASFVSDRQFSLQEGRVLAAWVFDDFYQILKTDETVKDYHHRLMQEHGQCTGSSSPEITPQEACFKIVFWDDNIDRIMPPHLAQILLLDGVFSYYEADPQTQELKLIFKEPYEETLAFKNKHEKKTP